MSDVVGSSAYILLHLPAQHLDSPNTTSAVTYKVQFAIRSDTSMSGYINRTHRNLDNAGGYDANGVSTLYCYGDWRMTSILKSHRNPRPNELEHCAND